jgi:hypothetical protein
VAVRKDRFSLFLHVKSVNSVSSPLSPGHTPHLGRDKTPAKRNRQKAVAPHVAPAAFPMPAGPQPNRISGQAHLPGYSGRPDPPTKPGGLNSLFSICQITNLYHDRNDITFLYAVKRIFD